MFWWQELATLDLGNCEYVTDEGVASVLAACPVLKVSLRAKSLQIYYRNAGETITMLKYMKEGKNICQGRCAQRTLT